jgi:hypothetical protein
MDGVIEPTDGKALPAEPEPPRITAVKDEVRRLRAELTRAVGDLDDVAGVRILHETSGVAILTKDGYRWHVHVARRDPERKGRLTMTLLSPQLRIVTALPTVAVGGTAQIRDILQVADPTGVHLDDILPAQAREQLDVTLIHPGLGSCPPRTPRRD